MSGFVSCMKRVFLQYEIEQWCQMIYCQMFEFVGFIFVLVKFGLIDGWCDVEYVGLRRLLNLKVVELVIFDSFEIIRERLKNGLIC